MLQNPTIRKVVVVLLSVLLSVVFIIEIRIGFSMLSNRISNETVQFSQISRNVGTASVSIDEIMYYPETNYPVSTGDIIALYNSNVKLQIHGTLTDNESAMSGIYKYSQDSTARSSSLYVEDKSRQCTDYMSAYTAYFDGDSLALLNMYGIQFMEENIVPFEQTYKDYRVPIVYNEGNDTYYGFIPEGTDKFWVITCTDPFIVSDAKVTAHFGDPSKDPMRSHTYSDYEVLASENKLREILERLLSGDEDAVVSSPYQSDGVVGTGDTYTSTSDNNIRKQMVSYIDYTWDLNGQAEGTNLTIDTTSSKAIASEWVLTATTYSYQNAGLQLLNLHGSKSSTSIEISGSIMNTLTTERPYVIVVKYINSARNLLGIDVLDNRQNKLQGNSYHAFTSIKYSTDFDLEDISAVQFEIY